MSASANPSLQKKTAARTCAVQCLYTLAITGEALDPPTQVALVKAQLRHNQNEQKLHTGIGLEPDYKLLEALLAGVAQWRADIDSRLESCLSAEWKRERMSPLLIAILQCAIFELFFYKDTKPNIVIDEYTRLTRSFFEEGDVNFVHGSLRALAERYAAPVAPV